MIGFFDSGLGGIQTMYYFREQFVSYDMIFLADSAYMPYGEKTPEIIQQRTFKGLHWLFDHGAKIVILACNTASAYAIKSWQKQYPEKKVLSVTIPGIEEMGMSQLSVFSVLTTKAMKTSDMYAQKFTELFPQKDVKIHTIDAGEWVTMIENGEKNNEKIKNIVDQFYPHTQVCVLGCTHFALIEKEISHFFDGYIINPSLIAAQKCVHYLEKHSAIKQKLLCNNNKLYYTTGSQEHMEFLVKKIYTEKCRFKTIYL